MTVTYEKSHAISGVSPSQIMIFIRNNFSVILIYLFIFFIGGAAAIFSENFRTLSNSLNIVRQSIVLGLIAIGQSLVVTTGGMDMSLSMTARLVALVVATLFNWSGSDSGLIFPLLLLGLTIGLMMGGINGFLITRTHANPFIITLGIASVLRGINLTISKTPIRGVPQEYLQVYSAKIGILPICVIVMALLWVLVWLFMTRTRLGRSINAVGGSERIARLSAIKVNRTLVMTYVLSALCAAAAGLFLLSRTGVGDPSAAEGMDFQSVVAVALGGINLYGGKGSVIGTLGGVLLLTLISNVFNLLQINIYYQQLILGLIVLIAVAVYKSPRSV